MSAFTTFCATEVRARSKEICRSWLDRLGGMLPVERRDVFPTHALLDHMPETVEEIAGYIDSDDSSDVIAASAVTEKARELGGLRFEQDASTHQILQEYDLLATVFSEFISTCRDAPSAPPPSPEDVHVVLDRVHRSIRVLTQASVDAFTARYAEMIQSQQETLRSFNQMVTHELRNPMSTIDLVAHLLGEESLRAEAKPRMVASLKTAVTKMSRTIQSLEELCEVTVDEQASPVRQTIQLGPLTSEVFEVLSTMASGKGVDLRLDENLPTFHSILHRVEMILVNLIANAIKYSDPTKSESFVAVEAVANDDGIAFCVRDNGIGIPKDRQEAVFGRFYRGHSDRDAELGSDGSGLGLAIVTECVKSVGGTIDLSSEEGVGSQFVVRLPASVLEGPDGPSGVTG